MLTKSGPGEELKNEFNEGVCFTSLRLAFSCHLLL